MSVQICIITIAGYGPWTLELGSDREHRLQSLQASLYRELEDRFSDVGGLVFQNRSDELFVLTNEISMAQHNQILGDVRAIFPDIRLAASVGCADDALGASKKAYDAINKANNTNVSGNICSGSDDGPDGTRIGTEFNDRAYNGPVILHMDIDGLSARRKKLSAYEITVEVYRLYSKMSEFFMSRNSLAFFMGGDNFMIISSTKNNVENDAHDFMPIVESLGLVVNCGVGRGHNARKAAANATRSLDDIRKMRKNGNIKQIHEAE